MYIRLVSGRGRNVLRGHSNNEIVDKKVDPTGRLDQPITAESLRRTQRDVPVVPAYTPGSVQQPVEDGLVYGTMTLLEP